MNEWNVSEEAAALLQDAHLWDMTVPLTVRTGEETLDVTLRRAVEHGYTLASLTISSDWEGLAGAIKAVARDRAYFLGHPDKYVLVERVEDVEAAKREGKIAILLHFQGTNPLDGDLNMVETYYKLGIRHMLITYNVKNILGDGCMEWTDDGLSRLGVAMIEEMNRVGMIVDATHTGYRTTMDMFEVSKDPVIFSHSNAAALWDIPRNAKDDQIKACAKTGGVMCINGVDIFLGDTGGLIELMVKHIAYVAELIGPENVGIGTDYEAYNYGRGQFERKPARTGGSFRFVQITEAWGTVQPDGCAPGRVSQGFRRQVNRAQLGRLLLRGARTHAGADRGFAQARLQRKGGARDPW